MLIDDLHKRGNSGRRFSVDLPGKSFESHSNVSANYGAVFANSASLADGKLLSPNKKQGYVFCAFVSIIDWS